MFIPLKDSALILRKPYVTYALLAINVIVYFYQVTLPEDLYREWFYSAGVVPYDVFRSNILTSVPSFFFSLFVHGGFFHLAGNMLYLWIFGDNIESALGHIRFLLFYLVCGIAATIFQVAINTASTLPIIGASGAISGILGAYIIRYSRARIQVLIWLIIFIDRIWIPAIYFIGFWFLIQVSNSILSVNYMHRGGVAWFAHIGGFLAGIILLLVNDPYERKRIWKKLNQPY